MTDLARPQARTAFAVAFAALVAAALAMAISPAFLRWSGVGPYTGAFYRVVFALPLLWLWAERDARAARRDRGWTDPGWTRGILLVGVVFAADLFFWHLSLMNTSVANAMLLVTMAPVWVAAFSGLFIGERVERLTVVGLAMCVAGGAYLVGSGWSLSADHRLGDIYAIITSFFFGIYFMVVRVARRDAPSGVILYRSSLISAALFFPIAAVMEGHWQPAGLSGMAAVVALALISHAGGQGLLTYALGHLSAAFSALVNFLEAIFAALLGWLLLSEPIVHGQIVGGAAILAGIWIARPRGR